MLLKVFQWLSLSFRIKSKFFRRFTYIYLKTIVCFVPGTIVDTGDTEMKKRQRQSSYSCEDYTLMGTERKINIIREAYIMLQKAIENNEAE